MWELSARFTNTNRASLTGVTLAVLGKFNSDWIQVGRATLEDQSGLDLILDLGMDMVLQLSTGIELERVFASMPPPTPTKVAACGLTLWPE